MFDRFLKIPPWQVIEDYLMQRIDERNALGHWFTIFLQFFNTLVSSMTAFQELHGFSKLVEHKHGSFSRTILCLIWWIHWKRGGRVSFYIEETIPFKVRSELIKDVYWNTWKKQKHILRGCCRTSAKFNWII